MTTKISSTYLGQIRGLVSFAKILHSICNINTLATNRDTSDLIVTSFVYLYNIPLEANTVEFKHSLKDFTIRLILKRTSVRLSIVILY